MSQTQISNQIPFLVGTPLARMYVSEYGAFRIRKIGRSSEIDLKGFLGDIDMAWMLLGEEVIGRLEDVEWVMEKLGMDGVEVVREAIRCLEKVRMLIDDVGDIMMSGIDGEEVQRVGWDEGYWVDISRYNHDVTRKVYQRLAYIASELEYHYRELDNLWNEKIEKYVNEHEDDDHVLELSELDEALNEYAVIGDIMNEVEALFYVAIDP